MIRRRSSENTTLMQLLGLAAAAHCLLALLFVVTLAHAAGQISGGDGTCTGENLIDRLRHENPDKLATREAEAAAIANGNSIFWLISGDGKADSWLFGTMHSPDPRIARLPDRVKNAFADATTVLVESVDAMDSEKMARAMVALRRYTMLQDGTTLESLLGAENAGRLREALAARNIPWQVANRLQPWMVAAAISVPVCDLIAKQEGEPVLDTALVELALQTGKTVVGLETIEEQFAAVGGVERSFHIEALEDMLLLGPLADDLMETTKQLYLEGDTAMMLPIVREFAPETDAGQGYVEFRQRLVSKRNRVMAARAAAKLDEGGVFIAVGALHLPGKDGMVSLLRERGYTLEPVMP